MATRTRDGAWVRKSFMMPDQREPMVQKRQFLFASMRSQFTDTTLGGNYAINPIPQFTRFADVKIMGKASQGKGQGRYYAEAHNENQQLIHMRFGVAQHNSLTTFFTGAYDEKTGELTKDGFSISSLFSTASDVFVSLLSIPLLPIIAAGRLYKFLAENPTTKFYFMEPAMPLYWNAVSIILNNIVVNLGLIPRFGGIPNAYNADPETGQSYSMEDMRQYQKLMPGEIFRDDGGVDPFVIATKVQRRANSYRERMMELLEDTEDRETMVQKIATFIHDSTGENALKENPDHQSGKSLDNYVTKYLEDYRKSKGNKNWFGEAVDQAGEVISGVMGWFDQVSEYAMAEIQDGGQFVSFRVDHEGEVSESFSNSAGESELAGKVNSMSGQARSARFNAAEGNVGGEGMLQKFVGGLQEVANSAMESVEMTGLASFAGQAFIDIPQYWQDSSVQFPSTSYTIQLRSPYGNPLSRLINLYTPLAMLLAGALPRSTGKRSYTSPFLCELYSKGRGQVRLGLIESLSVTRGTGNLGWSPKAEPLGMDVTITVADMSTVMHMPITTAGSSLNPVSGVLEEDTAFGDYMATLASMGLADQIFQMRKIRLNITRKISEFKQWVSPAKWTSELRSGLVGDAVSAFAREAARIQGN